MYLILQKDTIGKRKRPEGEEHELATYPERFNAHIAQAQNWLRMKIANKAVVLDGADALRCIAFEHPEHGDVLYEIHNRDALKLHEFVPKRDYTLAIVDVPYGLNLASCLHEDTSPWMEAEIKSMIQSLKIVTTARVWRIIIMHSIGQVTAVSNVLKDLCSGGIQCCAWYVLSLHPLCFCEFKPA